MGKQKRHYSHKKKIPILATAGAIGTAYAIYQTVHEKGTDYVGYAISGYDQGDKKFYSQKVIQTYAPAVAGVIGSMIASKSGLNRYLSGIPFLKF